MDLKQNLGQSIHRRPKKKLTPILNGESNDNLRALYYGYSSIWWGENDYRTYTLNLSSEEENNGVKVNNYPLFNTVTKSNIYHKKEDKIDYRSSPINGIISGYMLNEGNFFTVKYRTGAELEGGSGVDSNPAEHFKKGNIEDVVVAKNSLSPEKGTEKLTNGKRFFTFGDFVKNIQGVNADINQYCIIPANTTEADPYNININHYNNSRLHSFFISKTPIQEDEKLLNVLDIEKIILLQLMNAYFQENELYNVYEEWTYDFEKSLDYTSLDVGGEDYNKARVGATQKYKEALKKIYNELEVKDLVSVVDGKYVLTVNLNGTRYKMTYDGNNNYSIKTHKQDNNYKKLYVRRYKDIYTFQDDYNKNYNDRKLISTDFIERDVIKDGLSKFCKKFTCTSLKSE